LQHYLRAIRRKRYDAVIYAETLPGTSTSRQRLIDTGTPVVLIGGTAHPQADRVYIDDYAAARDVMAYLTGKGHQTIAHITGAPDMASSDGRRRGYRDGLTAVGIALSPDLEIPGTFLREGGYTAMQRLLTQPRRLSDAGVRVPDDIAIVGFDDITFAADTRPALTTVYHGQREIGHEAVRLALARTRPLTRGEFPEEKQTVIVPHRLVVRDSA